LTEKILYKDESYKIIGACLEVHGELGPGFHEQIYQEALAIEFTRQAVPFQRESELDIFYKDIRLNKKYCADFVCFDKIILELKATEHLLNEHMGQVLNYLKASRFRLGLLVNFGEKSLHFKRIIT